MPARDSRTVELAEGLGQLGLPDDEATVTRLLDYLDLLQKWNRTYNLVSESDLGSMVSRHLLDSLAIRPYLRGSHFVDVGSGAGLPGIPLAIVDSDSQFVLVDSNGKKARFLFQVKTSLGLGNIRVENCRIEHYQSNEQIDMVMCRALSALDRAVASCGHLLTAENSLLALKGQYPEAEIARLPAGFYVARSVSLTIPGNNSQRHLIEIRRRHGEGEDKTGQ